MPSHRSGKKQPPGTNKSNTSVNITITCNEQVHNHRSTPKSNTIVNIPSEYIVETRRYIRTTNTEANKILNKRENECNKIM